MNEYGKCPICNQDVIVYLYMNKDWCRYTCHNCGDYLMTGPVKQLLPGFIKDFNPEQRLIIGSRIRRHFDNIKLDERTVGADLIERLSVE